MRTQIGTRLGDAANAVFTAGELNGYIDTAIKSLYPTYFQYQVATTVAVNGPLQPMPASARNLYHVGLQSLTSTRVRLIRQWREGVGSSFIPKTGINGQTLVWSWTGGFLSPTDDVSVLDMGSECEQVCILRAEIAALERIVSSRVEIVKYFALTVREGVTETDLVNTIDALHASLDALVKQAVPRPVRIG